MRTFDNVALDSAIETIQMAALGGVDWTQALDRVAQVTGSTGGQLIGVAANGNVEYNLLTGVDPEGLRAFDDAGGNDPRINSRLAIGAGCNELEILDERHFTTAEDRARNAAYDDCLEKWQINNVCLTILSRTRHLGVGFAVNRSARQGGMSTEQTGSFAVLAHHMRHAVRVQTMLGFQAERSVSATLDQIKAIGFVCYRGGRVGAMSALGEQMVSRGDRLALRQGVLTVIGGSDTGLADAVAQTLAVGISPPLVVRDRSGRPPLIVEVARLPFRAAPFDEAVLVLVRDPESAIADRVAAAGSLFSYTPTETRVAKAMIEGQAPAAIAAALGVALATVRTHIRHIYEKSDVSSQLELTSLIGSLR